MTRQPKEIPIDDSPFYKSLLKRTQKLYLTKSSRVRRKFNDRDIYQRRVLEICLRISALLETLRLSRFFIGERIDIPADNNLKIKNADFIRYHIECYFLRITTYKDLMLKLYNRVFMLGIKEKIGLENNLKKRAEKDGMTDLLNLLEGLSILMANVEPIRHKIAHGGYHDDVDLILIEGEENIRQGGKRNSLSDTEYKATLKRLLTRNIIDMHMIEVMMATFILLSYRKIYKVRRTNEKELLQATKGLPQGCRTE